MIFAVMNAIALIHDVRHICERRNTNGKICRSRGRSENKYCFKMSSDESVVSSEMLIRLFLRWKVDQSKFKKKKKELYYLEEKQSSLRRHIMHGNLVIGVRSAST